MKKKILVTFILINIILITFIYNNAVFAANQTATTDINSIDSKQYPQLKEMLQELKKAHSNWNFKILYTDIEWKEAIANEYVGHGESPRNLIPANNSNYTGDWICKACGKDKTYDSGNWHCASESAIAYMMDPRNSLNKADIFQFMELTYNGCNMETIRKMVSGTFLNNEFYINSIIASSQKHNVNTYYVVARILQEQGKDGSVLVSGKGYNGEYVGYYNIFNIGATGNGKEAVILNGLKKAKSKGWTTLESSIDGGIESIAEGYIKRGQNTIYFQKFDVENSDGNLYWHQYMQNILAAQSEGTTLRKTFESVGTVEGEYTFIIPVYKNMPSVACSRPSTTDSNISTTSELVRVNVTKSLRLRDNPNGTNTVGWVYKDEVVTRLVKATEKIGGTYWDYVMKADGTKGYAARETYENENAYKLYLVPIEIQEPVVPEVPKEEIPEESGNITVMENNKAKLDMTEKRIKTIPNVTVKELKELIDGSVVVKDKNGAVISEGSKLATGCLVNDKYEISVLGDVNGDGEVDTGDTFFLKLLVLGQRTQQGGKCFEIASDVNQDGEVDTGDTFLLKKQVLKVSNITL